MNICKENFVCETSSLLWKSFFFSFSSQQVKLFSKWVRVCYYSDTFVCCEKYLWYLTDKVVSVLFRGNYLIIDLQFTLCTSKPIRHLTHTYKFFKDIKMLFSLWLCYDFVKSLFCVIVVNWQDTKICVKAMMIF